MSAKPSATEEVQDFGMGSSEPAEVVPIVYGVSSLGDPNELVWYSSQSTLREERGEGPAVETADHVLSKGGGPVGFISADPSVAADLDDYVLATWATPGSNGSITRSGGTSGPAISVSGAPKIKAAFKIEIQTPGIVGTATFRWSINGGSTWLESGKLTAGTVALGTTGVTVTFPAGTYVTGEMYAWTATPGGGYITASGTPRLDAFVRVEILGSGANGTATMRYCVDGYSGDKESERTYSEELTIPGGGTFVISGLNVTLTFDDGVPFVVGDYYTFSVTCAAWNSTDLADGVAALAGVTDAWRFLAAVTSKGNGDAAAHAVLAAALQSHLETMATASRYRRGMIPAEQGASAASAVTAFTNTVASRLLIPYGLIRRTTTKPFPGFGAPVTHSLDAFAARAAASLPSTDLKRVLSGPLEGLLKIFHDENVTATSLDNVKISTLRTHDGQQGFYITQGRLKSPVGSDFRMWPLGICMDLACETVHEDLVLAIGRGVRWNNDGTIDERDAVALEERTAAKLIARLFSPTNAEGFQGYVQDVRYKIDRAFAGRSTHTIIGHVAIKPLDSIDYVRTILGYVAELPAAA